MMSDLQQNKSDAEGQNSDAVPSIFKLNVDCLDKIFDYLSVGDLQSFGQTCKTMQQVTGAYFKINYVAAPKFCENDGIYTEYHGHDGATQRANTSAFNEFITYMSHYYEKMHPLKYVELHSNEFASMNHIYLVCVYSLNKTRIRCIQQVLSKVETVQVRNSTVEGDFYETLLKFCGNLKQLYVQEADVGHRRSWNNQIDNNKWLLHSYASLEHFELIPKSSYHIPELIPFFERNQSVRSFSTSSTCLWNHKDEFLKSNVKLDILEVKFFSTYYDVDSDDSDFSIMSSICNLLNELYERGFYKRLHFYVPRLNHKCSELLVSVHGLEKLCIKEFSESFNLVHLTNLKELDILNGGNAGDMEILSNSLVNLQRLFLRNASYNMLLPFIRRSMKLMKVKLFPNRKDSSDSSILKILTLNMEREKLCGADKVTIFVPDNIFLATKWKINNGSTNLNLVEMRRTDSYEWDNHY